MKIPKISKNSHPFKIPETFHGKFPKFPEAFRPFASLPRNVREAIFIKKELKPTLNRDRGRELSKIYDSLLATHLVLGYHQRSEVEDHQSVNTLLPTAEDGVGLLWRIRKLNVSVEDQFQISEEFCATLKVLSIYYIYALLR